MQENEKLPAHEFDSPMILTLMAFFDWNMILGSTLEKRGRYKII